MVSRAWGAKQGAFPELYVGLGTRRRRIALERLLYFGFDKRTLAVEQAGVVGIDDGFVATIALVHITIHGLVVPNFRSGETDAKRCNLAQNTMVSKNNMTRTTRWP
jgi:hypothetical protein